MTKIGLIGCGMWGRNLARNLAQLDVLTCVADADPGRAERFATQFDATARSVADLLADDTLDGIVLATSAHTHRDLAVAALESGHHVYVEKPLAVALCEAEDIKRAAQAAGRQVMVGHLIRYHDAFIELQTQVATGAIGHIRHITANRLAMGRIRSVESALFDLCPHDLSLVLALMGEEPETVSCNMASHVTPGVADFVSACLGFSDNRSAAINSSWYSPYKEHRLTVTGSTGALVFDDTRPWPEKLTLYLDDIRPDGEAFIIERASPVQLSVAESEPLKQEMRAFITCCETGAPPPTNIDEALAVQRVLEQMQTNSTAFGVPPHGIPH